MAINPNSYIAMVVYSLPESLLRIQTHHTCTIPTVNNKYLEMLLPYTFLFAETLIVFLQLTYFCMLVFFKKVLLIWETHVCSLVQWLLRQVCIFYCRPDQSKQMLHQAEVVRGHPTWVVISVKTMYIFRVPYTWNFNLQSS